MCDTSIRWNLARPRERNKSKLKLKLWSLWRICHRSRVNKVWAVYIVCVSSRNSEGKVQISSSAPTPLWIHWTLLSQGVSTAVKETAIPNTGTEDKSEFWFRVGAVADKQQQFTLLWLLCEGEVAYTRVIWSEALNQENLDTSYWTNNQCWFTCLLDSRGIEKQRFVVRIQNEILSKEIIENVNTFPFLVINRPWFKAITAKLTQ